MKIRGFTLVDNTDPSYRVELFAEGPDYTFEKVLDHVIGSGNMPFHKETVREVSFAERENALANRDARAEAVADIFEQVAKVYSALGFHEMPYEALR